MYFIKDKSRIFILNWIKIKVGCCCYLNISGFGNISPFHHRFVSHDWGFQVLKDKELIITMIWTLFRFLRVKS